MIIKKIQNYLKWVQMEFVYDGKFCVYCFLKHERFFKSFGKTYLD